MTIQATATEDSLKSTLKSTTGTSNQTSIDAESDAHSETSNPAFDDWDEPADTAPTQCLFCPHVASSVTDACLHMCGVHAFDVVGYTRNFDDYQRIRFVNWVRSHQSSYGTSGGTAPLDVLRNEAPAEFLAVHLAEVEDPSSADEPTYMRPVLEDDPLLYFDFDEALEAGVEALSVDDNGEVTSGSCIPASDNQFHAGASTIDYKAAYEQLCTQFADYRAFVQERALGDALSGKDEEGVPSSQSSPLQSSSLTDDRPVNTDEDMDYYFRSYACLEIHEEMLKDRVRTDAYRDFIYDNKHVFEGKVVLDVGCGTGVLSMFAAKAGARKVYAVDASSLIDKARRNAEVNGLADRIEFIRGKVEHLQLKEPVDIIVSEWMGYGLLYEGMLDSVIAARDKWMRPPVTNAIAPASRPGFMCPSRATMHLAAVECTEWLADRHDFWNNVYGFDMTSMKEFMQGQAVVDVVEGDSVATSVQTVASFDLNTVATNELDFTAPFCLTATRSVDIFGLLLWFDMGFDGPASTRTVTFTTGPQSTPTHWKQTLMLFKDGPVALREGEQLVGTFDCRKHAENPRGLSMMIEYRVKGQNCDDDVRRESYNLA